jgi:phosphinothricin acetyltransferase
MDQHAGYTLVPLAEEHRDAAVAIFNHYVSHGFAAFNEEPVGGEFFGRPLAAAADGYPALAALAPDGAVAGFALLRPIHPAPTLRRTAEVTYFLHPDHTGRGAGTAILARFEAEARALGADSLLAKVSSLNPGSLRFHRRHGFRECGRFRAVGRKHGREFDLVWFQKRLAATGADAPAHLAAPAERGCADDPPVVARRGWRYHHLGVPTRERRPGESYLPAYKTGVRGFETSPYGIEWMRFEPGCPLPDLVQTVPHLAFVVDDLAAELAGQDVLIAPNSPTPGVTVAFIVADGAPVELMQFDPEP